MSDSQNRSRGLGAVAVAACGLLAVSACSSSGSGGKTASSSALSSTSTMSSSTSPSTTPSVSRSVLASSSSGPAKASSSSASPSKSTRTVHLDPIGACLTANRENNAASSQWNAAVNSQSASKLNAAAKNFRTTADSLRKLPAKSGDKGFASRIKMVAGDLDALAKARFDGKTVDTATYNTDSEKLRSYCQALITKG